MKKLIFKWTIQSFWSIYKIICSSNAMGQNKIKKTMPCIYEHNKNFNLGAALSHSKRK